MIKKDLLQTEPIKSYYETFKTEGKKIITETVSELLKSTEHNLDDLLQKIAENKQLKHQINAKKTKNDDINYLNSQNHLIKMCCVFLVGLPFLGKYFQNKKRIESLKQTARANKQRVNENETAIFNEKIAILSGITMDKMVGTIFQKFGFEPLENFNYEQVLQLVRLALNFDERVATDDPNYEPQLIGFDWISAVRLNNRPIYDVGVRILTYNVAFKTGNDEHSRGKVDMVRIPQIVHIRWIFGPTNFLSPLAIGMDQERLSVYYNENNQALKILLEKEKKNIEQDFSNDYITVPWQKIASENVNLNALSDIYRREVQYQKLLSIKECFQPHSGLQMDSEFDDTFPYGWNGSRTELTKFFSPTAQTQIMHWFNVNRASWANLSWLFTGGEALSLSKKEVSPIFFNNAEQFLSTKKNDLKDFSIDNIQEKIVDKLIIYFDEWFNRTQWLFLFPAICGEWYNTNLYYTTEAGEPDPDPEFPNHMAILNGAVECLTMQQKTDLAPWINLDQIQQFRFSDHVVRNDVKLCSIVRTTDNMAEQGGIAFYNTEVYEQKIVYTITKKLHVQNLSFLFDAQNPDGFIGGDVHDLNTMSPEYTNLFNKISNFYEQHPDLRSISVLKWQKNYGVLVINDIEQFDGMNIEDAVEEWLEQLVDDQNMDSEGANSDGFTSTLADEIDQI